MHSLSGFVVGSLWVACVLVAIECTAFVLAFFARWTKDRLVLQTNTAIPNVIPLRFSSFNRFFGEVSHISHRTYKSKNELYKYIITRRLEDL